MSDHSDFFRNATRRYVWDSKTFQPYQQVMDAVILHVRSEIDTAARRSEQSSYASSEECIGIIQLLNEEDKPFGTAIYINDDKKCSGFQSRRRPPSLYKLVKDYYRLEIGLDHFIGFTRAKVLEERFHPLVERGIWSEDQLKAQVNARINLVSTFEQLANKSLDVFRNNRYRVAKALILRQFC